VSPFGRYRRKPALTAAERRRRIELALRMLAPNASLPPPPALAGRGIARTFWGRAWCTNLEHYSDYANRLPRGRTYWRQGAVIELRIAPGAIEATVSGTRLYRVKVAIAPVTKPRWAAICKDCAGSIDSLVELLQGRLSEAVMARICQPQTGLFPAPAEIRFSCSCPDWASMCKHVAAVFYGVGARLDEEPALLFALRRVDAQDLISRAGAGKSLGAVGPSSDRVLPLEGLSALFGLELGCLDDEAKPPSGSRAARKRSAAVGKAKGRSRAETKAKPEPKLKPRSARKKSGQR